MSTKVFALLFVLCFALSSVLAQLDDSDLIIVYDQGTLPTTVGVNITGWTNSAAAGVGDLIAGTTPPLVATCNGFPGASFNGASSLVGSFAGPISIDATETVVVVFVGSNSGTSAGRQGILSTSNTPVVPWAEGSVGPGLFVSGTEYYEDAESATTSNVAGTSGIAVGEVVALGFAYTPDAAETTDDYVVIDGGAVQFFSGTSAAVETSNAFAAINVGWRASGSDLDQYFDGCILYIGVYVIATPVDVADVASTVAGLYSRFGVTGTGNGTTVPSPSPLSRTTTTGSRTTTTGRRSSTAASTTTTGRRGSTTTGRRTGKTSTTGVSAASLPVVAPMIQALFLAVISCFLFFMW